MQNHHTLTLETPERARMGDDEKRHIEKQLSAEFAAWSDAQGLPPLSAEELLHENLTAEQRAWVSDFIRRWEDALS